MNNLKYLIPVGLLVIVGGYFIVSRPLGIDVASKVPWSAPATPTPESLNISMLHFGDVMVGRAVAPHIAKGLNPFEHIRDLFTDFDIVALNLEGPISETQDCQKKEIVFRFVPSTVNLLKDNGVSIVNLANNHGYDCKSVGLADTKRFLKEGGVDYFGTMAGLEDIAVKTVQGKTIAFLGADLIASSPQRFQAFLDSITKAQEAHDYVIVHVHWGDEYKVLPNAAQKSMGHQIIDAGADVIIGHHPHVVETAEVYKGKAIFYSLGNFVFDQYMPGTKEGIGVSVIQQENATRFYVYPFDIVSYQAKLKPYEKALETCDFVLQDIANRDGCFFELPR